MQGKNYSSKKNKQSIDVRKNLLWGGALRAKNTIAKT